MQVKRPRLSAIRALFVKVIPFALGLVGQAGRLYKKDCPIAPVGINAISMLDKATGETQRCFLTEDGFMVCNFVVRKGRIVRSRSGKCLKFRPRRRLRKRNRPQISPQATSR